jgi:hypothetical protein
LLQGFINTTDIPNKDIYGSFEGEHPLSAYTPWLEPPILAFPFPFEDKAFSKTSRNVVGIGFETSSKPSFISILAIASKELEILTSSPLFFFLGVFFGYLIVRSKGITGFAFPVFLTPLFTFLLVPLGIHTFFSFFEHA